VGSTLNAAFPEAGAAPAVGVWQAGAIAYVYHGSARDLLGLNWVAMGHSPGDRVGIRAHSAFDADVFWEAPPELMLPTPLPLVQQIGCPVRLCAVGCNASGAFSRRRGSDQRVDGKEDAGRRLDLAHQHDGGRRVAAELEEVVVGADCLDSENDGKAPGTRGKMMAMLRAELIAAQEYMDKQENAEEGKEPSRDLRKEALVRVLRGETPLLITVDRAQDIASARRGWEQGVAMIEAASQDPERYHLVILDEINIALRYGYLDADEVAQVLRDTPGELSIMVTGRDAPQAVIDVADTVSRIECVKHAFEAGIKARRGIDY